nr:MAG TPA: hypothetical protein [Caudoviricetes sp.]
MGYRALFYLLLTSSTCITLYSLIVSSKCD